MAMTILWPLERFLQCRRERMIRSVCASIVMVLTVYDHYLGVSLGRGTYGRNLPSPSERNECC